ncbi:hypothetical protein BgiBS90_006080 [Biomphalaria glabrata]|nr:hypothetical protein BgiBS90_006080 [Biomphalaria glabrata]
MVQTLVLMIDATTKNTLCASIYQHKHSHNELQDSLMSRCATSMTGRPGQYRRRHESWSNSHHDVMADVQADVHSVAGLVSQRQSFNFWFFIGQMREIKK